MAEINLLGVGPSSSLRQLKTTPANFKFKLIDYYAADLNVFLKFNDYILPKVDVRLVIALTISVISVVQYYSSWTNYEDAIKYIMTVPKYRLKATEIAKEDGLLKNDKKANRGPCKSLILPVSQDFVSAANAMATYKVTQSYGPSIYYVSNFRGEGV